MIARPCPIGGRDQEIFRVFVSEKPIVWGTAG